MGSIFTIFGHLTELWVSFSVIFRNFRNYGPDFHSNYGIMTLKSTRIYGIMGTDFSGKMARPRQKIGRDTPRESKTGGPSKYLFWCNCNDHKTKANVIRIIS